MITPNRLPKHALGAALLMIAAPAGALADTAKFEIAFQYHDRAPAEKIYADLERTARFACLHAGVRDLTVRKAEKACVAEVVEDGVSKLNRSDIAQLHTGRLATMASR